MSHMLSPTNAQFILAWINSINSITWCYRILFKLFKNMKIKNLFQMKEIM